jgi:hypothetical protein
MPPNDITAAEPSCGFHNSGKERPIACPSDSQTDDLGSAMRLKTRVILALGSATTFFSACWEARGKSHSGSIPLWR